MARLKNDGADSGRLKAIVGILVKNDIIKGIHPERLRAILEDLGPTFIKLGQIMSMRSDLLPREYCDELEKLRTNVPPMNYSEVKTVIRNSLGRSVSSVFTYFDKTPLGSASIAQAHKARLLSGEWVVVKVQRDGIKEIMAQDILLLKKAARVLKLTRGAGDVLDFDTIVDELWNTTQEELDFLKEAAYLEEFYANNLEISYVTCPKVYRPLTTSRVLVMEYIDGIPIDQKAALIDNGYDLFEIGQKIAENYAKQVMDDGLFHADAHPGNILIRKGEVVWIDLGMMGRLSRSHSKQLLNVTEALTHKDAGAVKDVVMAISVHKSPVDHSRLYTDVDEMVNKYVGMDFGDLHMGLFVEDMMRVAQNHKLQVPSVFSMLGRGLANIEGLLELMSPDLSFLEVAAAHRTGHILENADVIRQLKASTLAAADAFSKLVEMPTHITNVLTTLLKGHSKLGMELQASNDFQQMANRLVNNLVLGMIIAALLISSSMLATTDMQPKLLNIPFLGAAGYAGAAVLSIWLIIDLKRKR